MSVRPALPRTFAAALACAALTLNAAHANDTAVFRDALKPGGKARSAAQKFADGEACGTTGPHHAIPFMPAFEKCMNGKGWVIDHYASNDIPAPGGTNDHYVDIKGDGNDHERSDAALAADTRACKASKTLNACLADRGWKYTITKYGPPVPRRHAVASAPQSSGWSWSSGSSNSSSSSWIDDEVRHTEESNRQTQADSQAASDAMNAAIQQSNALNAASQQQIQLQQDLANAPQPPN